jgi:chromosome segregation ATPase
MNAPRKKPITYSEFEAAADSIAAGGGNPTIRSVYDKLEKRGGNDTLIKFMKIWQAKSAAKNASSIVISPGLADTIRSEIEKHRAEVRNEVAAEIQQHEEDNKYLAEQADRLLAQSEVLTDQVSDLSREYDAALVRLADRQAELTEIKAQLLAKSGEAETARTNLALVQNDAQHIGSQLQKKEAGLEKTAEKITELKHFKGQLMHDMTDKQMKLREVEAQLSHVKLEKATATDRIDKLENALEEEREKRVKYEIEAERYKTRLENLGGPANPGQP